MEPISKYKFVISADPGIKNYAVTIYKRSSSGKFKSINAFHTQYTIDSLKPENFRTQALLFEDMWQGLLEYYTKPDIKTREKCLIVVERFQNRGVKTHAVELVTTMNSLVYSVGCTFGYDTIFIPASQWKNRFKQLLGKATLDLVYCKADSMDISNHVVDSTLLGQYMINKFEKFKITKSFYKRLEQRLEHG